MSGASERDELHSLISGVRRCIAALQSQDGDRAPMRRIVNAADRLLNDIDRLDIDTDELDSGRAAPQLHGREDPLARHPLRHRLLARRRRRRPRRAVRLTMRAVFAPALINSMC
jgi:hypothetical protein